MKMKISLTGQTGCTWSVIMTIGTGQTGCTWSVIMTIGAKG